MVKEAIICFELLKESTIKPDEVYYNILINGLMKLQHY